MANINELFDTVGGWLKALVGLGLNLILLALVVDVLFDGWVGIVDGVVAVIESFVGNGVVGLIALLFFLAIYRD